MCWMGSGGLSLLDGTAVLPGSEARAVDEFIDPS